MQNMPGSKVTRSFKGQLFIAQVLTVFFDYLIILNADYINCVHVVVIKVTLNPTVHSYVPANEYCSN